MRLTGEDRHFSRRLSKQASERPVSPRHGGLGTVHGRMATRLRHATVLARRLNGAETMVGGRGVTRKLLWVSAKG